MSSHAAMLASYRDHDTITPTELATARAQPRPHPTGKPVSRSTYVTHGCRCDGCRAANTAHTRTWRGTTRRPHIHPIVINLRAAERANRDNTARYRARAELAERHPDEYRQLYNEQRRLIATERGPLPGEVA